MPVVGIVEAGGRVSSVLFGNRTFHVNQIVQSLGGGSGAVQRELRMLTEAGILERTKTGNMVNYRANSLCPIFKELKIIVRKTFGAADAIGESLEALKGGIRVAFIFGSVARGADYRASDIDLLIVGDISFDQAMSSLAPAQEALGREINPAVYSVAEYRRRFSQNRSFVREVSEGEKIFIIGDEDELGRLGRRRQPAADVRPGHLLQPDPGARNTQRKAR